MLGVLALLVGCQNEELYQEEESLYSFDVSLESIISEPDTKTYADEQHLVVWHNDDRVSVFEKKEYWEEYKYTGRTGTTGGRLDKITNEGSGTGGDLDYYYAVYPHSELNGFNSQGHLLLTLPHEQLYDEFSFGRGTNLMVSSSEDDSFKFKNIGGYLVFKLYGEGVSVSTIRLVGNNEEEITGDIDVVISPGTDPVTTMSTARYAETYNDAVLVCDPPIALGATAAEYKEFWFVLPPMTFEGGFSIDVTTSNGDVWTKTTTKSWTITRNHYTPVSAMEVVLEPETTVPIPEAVDMGLSVKWASFNLGASAPEEFGEYYAWGEVDPKERYDWDTYKWCEGTKNTLTKYNKDSDLGEVDNKADLDLEDDAAHYALHGDWHMPSLEDWEELMDSNNCEWAWTTKNGISGYLVTSKLTENSIFLPAAGNKHYDSLNSSNSWGYYWLNELADPNYSRWKNYNCNSLSTVRGTIRASSFDAYIGDRVYGYSIRPVLENTSNPLSCDNHVDLLCNGSRHLSVLINDGSSPELTYSSKDESIATVDNAGTIIGISTGSTIVRVSTSNGNYSAYCSVTVYPSPEAVDLGLSVKWASFDIGASHSEEYGLYFAWGEIRTKSDYTWETYKWCNGDRNSLTKYNTHSSCGVIDDKTELDSEDDVARVWSGGKWRMPTYDEMLELLNNCSYSRNETTGALEFISKETGNMIGFPASGYKAGTTISMYGNYGYNYTWTSTLCQEASHASWILTGESRITGQRSSGSTIRPVLVE